MTSSELTTSPADVKVSVRPDWRLPVTLGISFLPWFVVVLFTGGIWSAVDFAAYALGVLGAGYGVVCLAIAGSARTQGLFLAPALGILTVSATGAFWLRVGLPLPWVWGVWLCLAIPGMVSSQTLPYHCTQHKRYQIGRCQAQARRYESLQCYISNPAYFRRNTEPQNLLSLG